MPDNRKFPDENYDDENDVPFKLPKSEDYDAPTGDHPLSDEELRAQDRPLTEPSMPDTDDAITAQWEEIDDDDEQTDQPPATETLDDEALTEAYVSDETEDIVIPTDEELRAQDRARSKRTSHKRDDDDVPFKLPHADDLPPEEDGRIINKMMTMPHQPSPDAHTLAGSGGLDPNPDFVDSPRSEPTMKHQPVRAPQRDADRTYQRPAPTVQNQAPVQGYAPPPPPNAPPQQAVPGSRPLPRRRQHRRSIGRPGCLAIMLGLLLTFCGGLTVITTIVGTIAYARVGDLLNESVARIDDYDQFQSTFLMDRNGNSLFEIFNEGRRTKISLDRMPADLINATIAIEDDEFYSNIGIDIGATSVAFLQYVGAGVEGETGGGSTITQQLVRNVLFDYEYRIERSVTRKIEEILLAIALNGRKSKDEVLEMYLNEIYYGNLAYGVEAAAQIYFGKPARDLTLGESALLAGLPNDPANLNPLDPNPVIQQRVETRWRLILGEMLEERYITQEQHDAALREGYTLRYSDIDLLAPHFTVFAQDQLEELMGNLGYSPEEIALGGLRVYTTLDLNINDMVQGVVKAQVDRLRPTNNVGNGAAVVIKPITGEILAMVGSADYYDDSIDGRVNVTTAIRQPGSTVKVFNYAAAIERGMTPGDVIWDTQTRIGIPGQPMYEPVNYDGSFHGPMRMRYALANSYNVPAVQTLRHNVGVDYLINFMNRLGLNSISGDASLYGLSLTLGGGEVSPLELTRGFAVFANEGRFIDTNAILCVIDSDDNIIYNYENLCPEGQPTPTTFEHFADGRQVLDPRIAFVISDMLSDNGARTPAMGPNSQLHTPGINTAVKTGTTNDNKDNWTVGYTRNVAVGVWVGNSRGEPMIGTSGLSGAAPIWNEVTTTIYNNQGFLNQFAHRGQLYNDQLQQPSGVSLQRLCDVRALIDPAPQCNSFINEYMLDSPAAVPNAQGGMDFPQAPPSQPVQPPSSGPYVIPEGPGIFRSVVQPLSPDVASAIQFAVGAGEISPPAPKYCRVLVEQIATTSGAREQLFIAPPPDAADAARAEHYARGLNLAFLPTIDCTPDLIGGGQYGPTVAAAYISSPSPGQVIPAGGMDIIGTVQFDPSQANFYKLEIRGGQFPNWTTIGDIHYENSIVEGRLEFLPGSPGLQPGDYELKLAIIANNAEPLQAPYIVPFKVQ